MTTCDAYPKFPKIPRLNRTSIITEKIDGTNALVHIDEAGIVRAGSRSRWITTDNDNFGFAAWVAEHADELLGLGPGHHYGEWYGKGIQRGYGLDERRFALFNTGKWLDPAVRPACCHVVPVLATVERELSHEAGAAIGRLRRLGSVAVPGFANPEGVVVFHAAAGQYFKALIEGDEIAKGVAA
jgi:hypothetical protein